MKARRADANQAAIVRGLRALGASVLVANAEVDLIIGWRGRNYLLEVKSGPHSPLKARQQRLRAEWRGQYAIVHSLDEALVVIGAVEVACSTGSCSAANTAA